MALVPLPEILSGVLVRNPITGIPELPEDSTEEQKRAFENYQENIEIAQMNMCVIVGSNIFRVKSLVNRGKSLKNGKIYVAHGCENGGFFLTDDTGEEYAYPARFFEIVKTTAAVINA